MFYVAILILVYAHHNWMDFNSPPLSWKVEYGLAFALYSAAIAFTVLAVYLCSAKANLGLLDAIRPQLIGILPRHYIFIIWLQYAVYDASFPAFVKFLIVFIGTLSGSWALVVALRKIPVVARIVRDNTVRS